MVTSTANSDHQYPPQKKPLQIKQDDKFYSRLLSKENSNSFRVYYGVHASGAVPFMWESQPGTPKKSFNDNTIPPLTPPPSYLYLNSKKKPIKKHPSSKSSKLLPTMFPRLLSTTLKKNTTNVSSLVVPSLSSSSSISSFTSSSLSYSSAPTTPSDNNVHSRRNINNRFSSPRSSFDSRSVDYDDDFESPTSILCFGSASSNCSTRNGHNNNNGSNDDHDGIRGCYSMVIMKRVLLSIVGGNGSSGSAQGTAASA